MGARLRYVLDLIRNSYWFLPAAIAIGAILLSVATLAVDGRFELEGLEEIRWVRSWIYAGGPEGAREVLSTIAGSMITVAGVVFSITIVALTLASSQFGPRVLDNFMRDEGNKVVLGTFIATFLYSLLVLRTIRNGGDDASAVVPHVSVTVALILALTSLSVLIYFIHHVVVSIQAPHLIAAISHELQTGITGLVPDEATPPAPDGGDQRDLLPERFEERSTAVLAERTGYIDAVDAQKLLELAEKHRLLVRLEHRPGHFVVKGSVLARLWPPERADREMAEDLREACVIGPRRTALQDIEFPVNQLVEVAVRALSPGINDPFTAITCIDQLSAGLCALASRPFPPSCWFGEDGELRMVVSKPMTFEGVVDAAFHQIRQNAAGHAAVHIRMLEGLATVVDYVMSAERLDPLVRQADLILERSEEEVRSGADRQDVRDRYAAMKTAAAAKLEELRRRPA